MAKVELPHDVPDEVPPNLDPPMTIHADRVAQAIDELNRALRAGGYGALQGVVLDALPGGFDLSVNMGLPAPKESPMHGGDFVFTYNGVSILIPAPPPDPATYAKTQFERRREQFFQAISAMTSELDHLGLDAPREIVFARRDTLRIAGIVDSMDLCDREDDLKAGGVVRHIRTLIREVP